MQNKKKRGPGRGWHGDSEGHAKAGRKGGRARGKKMSQEVSVPTENR